MNENDFLRLSLPDGTQLPYLTEDGYAEKMRTVVEPWLASFRKTVEVPVRDGTIHMENYALPGSKKAVLMMHGYTESAEKLREMVWYFLHAGFSVYSYDQRGHGRSVRSLSDETITHVDRFSDYLDDADELLRQVILPERGDRDLILFGHSMGGAVAAHFLQRHPELFKRAVLTSPMIEPSAGSIPAPVARLMTRAFCLAGKARERAFIGKPYDARTDTYDVSCTTSEARFSYYRDKRAVTRLFQNSSPSYGWACQAATQTKKLLKAGLNRRIQTPVLLCQAELDNVVLLAPQEAYIRLLTHGKLMRFHGKHELFNSEDTVMKQYIQAVIGFMKEE